MTDENRFSQRVDVLDLIISTLKEHEKALDDKVGAIDGAVADLKRQIKKLEAPEGITFTARVRKSGNSISVNIVRAVKEPLGLKVGDDVEVTLRKL